MYLFDRRYNTGNFGNGLVFVETVVVSVLGIVSGFVLFPSEASLIAIFLIAFGQARTVEVLLDRNRDEIWNGFKTPAQANFRLAASLLTMFMGILASYAVAALVVSGDAVLHLFGRQVGDYGGHSITEVVFDDFTGILGHNLVVLVICFVFALVYRHGGMLLVLAWNASVWGVVFPYVARTAPDLSPGGPAVYFAKSFICIFPHLSLEAAAYTLAAMAAVFLSKAVQKYDVGSERFTRVGASVLRISALSLVLLVVACAVEAFVAPALIHALF